MGILVLTVGGKTEEVSSVALIGSYYLEEAKGLFIWGMLYLAAIPKSMEWHIAEWRNVFQDAVRLLE